MKSHALTEDRPMIIKEDHPAHLQHDDIPDEGQWPDPEAGYPREFDKRGLLVSVVISVAVVLALLVFAVV